MLNEEDGSKKLENEWEEELIGELIKQGYEYKAEINSEEELVKNLIQKLKELNKEVVLSDYEWEAFVEEQIIKDEEHEKKIRKIQGDEYIRSFRRRNEEYVNIKLIDKNNILNNQLQVINQFQTQDKNYRYDVVILVNGFPLIHIELKHAGRGIAEAFKQINKYKNHFGNSLFSYVHIFVISTGTETKYFSNIPKGEESEKTRNHFLFASNWSINDEKNTPQKNLIDFAKTFLERERILSIITKYCIVNNKGDLIAMRPYQIYATEKIIEKINQWVTATNVENNKYGGYIWHATGSGKTLTSFKTANLALNIRGVEKVLFVVDRKELDIQTAAKYSDYEKGSSVRASSIENLGELLENDERKVIITTIHKLHKYLQKHKNKEVLKKRMVMIFDECHRSQAGDMHIKIKEKFHKSCLFGFTGTPILRVDKDKISATTDDLFKEKLHSYTLLNAIEDKKVLPFYVEYVGNKNPSIQRQKKLIVEWILREFDTYTCRSQIDYESIEEKREKGFNSMFAVESINDAIDYYKEFKEQIKELPEKKKIVVSCVFSTTTDDEEEDSESGKKRKFLEEIMDDYNEIFNEQMSIKEEDRYKKQVADKVRSREIDLLIVVDMFLTGFDAPSLNTLWVDKNLEKHSLIQAFSRTNRIYNELKEKGFVICFKDLKEQLNEAINIYADGNVNLFNRKSFEELYETGYKNSKGEKQAGFKEIASKLKEFEDEDGSINVPEKKENEAEFIDCMRKAIDLWPVLKTYPEFRGQEILTEEYLQRCQGKLHEIKERRDQSRAKVKSKKDIEIEGELNEILEKLWIIEITAESLKKLIIKKEDWGSIEIKIDSSENLRPKKSLYKRYWERGVEKEEDFCEIALAEAKLELESIRIAMALERYLLIKYAIKCLKENRVESLGTDITDMMEPCLSFDTTDYEEKEQRVVDAVESFRKKYSGEIKDVKKLFQD